jgi:hypothetical protein
VCLVAEVAAAKEGRYTHPTTQPATDRPAHDGSFETQPRA